MPRDVKARQHRKPASPPAPLQVPARILPEHPRAIRAFAAVSGAHILFAPPNKPQTPRVTSAQNPGLRQLSHRHASEQETIEQQENGTMSGTPQTRINEFLANTTSGALRPQIETLPNGNFLVTYATTAGGLSIRGQQFDADGNAVGTEINFDFGRKIEVPAFDILVQPNGQVVIVAEVDEIALNTPRIVAQTFDLTTGGDITATHELVVPIRGLNDTYNPSIVGNGNGIFSVFFGGNNFGLDRLAAVGGFQDQSFNFFEQEFGGNSDADISTALMTNGNIALVLDRDADKGIRSKFDIRIFTSSNEQIATIQTGGGARIFDTTVEALTGGGFVVAWSQLQKVLVRKEKQDTEVFVQMFDENGTATSPKMRVGETRNNDHNTNASIVALEDGGFIVFYDKGRHEPGVNGQRYDAEGNTIGEEFQVFDGRVGNIDATLLADDTVAVSFEVFGRTVQVEILEFGQVIRGDDTAEELIGTERDDLIEGGGGDDILRGDAGEDQLNGGDGDDSFFGGADDDTLEGGAGNDFLRGGNGNDRISGGSGDDIVSGNIGDDRLEGGAGNDQYFGGGGSDTFVFSDGDGVDEINDFDALDDAEVIDLSGVTEIADFADLAARHMTQVGETVVIDDGAGLQITLRSVDLDNLDANDFLF
ncbi:MAG: calcium-binding protein [Pseudomonadota bacterium]